MLKDEIQKQFVEAFKARDSFRSTLLNMVKSAIQYKEIDLKAKSQELNDEIILQVIQSEIKKRKEAITLYVQGNRMELADKEEKEIEILKKFLPTPLTAKEIEIEVDKIILGLQAKTMQDFGKVMKAVNQTLKGKTDGLTLKNLVEGKLNKE